MVEAMYFKFGMNATADSLDITP